MEEKKKKHLNVVFVKKHLLSLGNYEVVMEVTQANNHSCVNFVKHNLLIPAI